MINIGHQFVKYGLSLLRGKFAVNTKAKDDVDALIEGTTQTGVVNSFLLADSGVLDSESGAPTRVKDGYSAVVNNELVISDGDTLIIEGTVTVQNENSIVSNQIPVSSNAQGAIGEIAYDDNYMYVCINENTWKRTPLSVW